jgi:hypothetical protein
MRSSHNVKISSSSPQIVWYMYPTASHLILHASRAWCSRGYLIVDVDQNAKRYGLDLHSFLDPVGARRRRSCKRYGCTTLNLRTRCGDQKSAGHVRINTAVDQRSSSVVNEKLSRFGRIFLRVEETANLHFLVEVRTYSTKKPKRLKFIGRLQKVWRLCGKGKFKSRVFTRARGIVRLAAV